MKGKRQSGGSVQAVEALAAPVAQAQGLELVEITLQKEPQGKTLCLYVDKPSGITLDDCERFHKAIQPLLESMDYDFLEVSSPGVDRPITTQRDFEKNRGALVEVRLYAPKDGTKVFQGTLMEMDETGVTLQQEHGEPLKFDIKAVALIKPVIIFEDDEEQDR